jgi:NAD(P)-dependent dehydrogenase (short-subunit alcohol dehydrogenase family)
MNDESPVAIVSGAGSGMGRAVAIELARRGHRLVLVDLSAPGLDETQSSLADPAVLEVADVSDRARVFEGVAAAEERFGRLDALVNAAGILIREGAIEHSLENWRRTLGVNLDGPFWFSQAFARAQLKAGRGGAILNIASIEAPRPQPNHIAYSASKGALEMLTKAMALDLAPHGVRVNAVGPGVIETAINASLRADPVRSDRLRAQIPLGRVGAPQEVANVIAFLLSDEASYITGEMVLVDGGWAIT